MEIIELIQEYFWVTLIYSFAFLFVIFLIKILILKYIIKSAIKEAIEESTIYTKNIDET